MTEDTKISDLTVAEFRLLMAQCFKAQKDKEQKEIWGQHAVQQAAQMNLNRHGHQSKG